MSKTNTVLRIGLMAGLLPLTGLPAAAQNVNDPKIQDREVRQQERIQQGVNSGQLTQGEATRLENQQSRLKAAEDRLKANGNLSPAERARLTRMQNRASRDICRKKHNTVKAN
jgi:hypothetical protein